MYRRLLVDFVVVPFELIALAVAAVVLCLFVINDRKHRQINDDFFFV